MYAFNKAILYEKVKNPEKGRSVFEAGTEPERPLSNRFHVLLKRVFENMKESS